MCIDIHGSQYQYVMIILQYYVIIHAVLAIVFQSVIKQRSWVAMFLQLLMIKVVGIKFPPYDITLVCRRILCQPSFQLCTQSKYICPFN